MSAVGPATPVAVITQLPEAGQVVTIGTADQPMSALFNAGRCRRIICQTAGTIYLQMSGDAAALKYVLVAGQQLDGDFILIGGTTNYASSTVGMVVNCVI